MASRLLVTRQGNTLLMACQDQGWTRHDSRHANTKGCPRHGNQIACHRARQCIAHSIQRPRVANALLMACQNKGGQGMASPLLVTGQGNALVRHAKTNGGKGMAHGMPKQGVAKAWQANWMSPGKAMHCSWHAKTKGGQGINHGIPKQGVAKAWQADCLLPGKAMHCSRHAKIMVAKAWQAICISPGKAMHCSRHAKTKGDQGMTHGMPIQGWPRHGKPIACHRAM
ncbi:hypothetical protein RHGRI_001447 [Rhododendron griersonianum]|uniref:Uncharacterized protein n=1 Tax=Rhododendron griersonianum TaxID=479676 RepID=A0AAV6LMD1_9ERIC|nr:hypothetical protein RHGRI_001447 [Rhododendron griersonianum]